MIKCRTAGSKIGTNQKATISEDYQTAITSLGNIILHSLDTGILIILISKTRLIVFSTRLKNLLNKELKNGLLESERVLQLIKESVLVRIGNGHLSLYAMKCKQK